MTSSGSCRGPSARASRHRSALAGFGALVILAAAGAPDVAAGGPAATPAEATVFIRVTGDVRAEYMDLFKQSREVRGLELATGSGFVVSPAGHVLTNHHVISGGDVILKRAQGDVHLQLDVTKIEVVLPSEGASGESERSFVASVEAVDPDLDLAVLSVGGELPFLHLGDSDVLETGQPITVWGFPLGRKLELGRSGGADVPQVSASRGLVGAVRRDDRGEARYVQTDAAINPGSSGGPMLDADGYVVGVVELKLREGTAIGFGIPINLVKDFIETRGPEPSMPSRRLKIGPPESLRGKGLSLRIPEGMEDVSPHRLLCSSGGSGDEVLRVDRVSSPLGLPALELLLLSGKAFESFSASPKVPSRAASFGELHGLMGWARAETGDGGGRDIEYALVDLGREKLVARYVGPSPQMAFNRGLLRSSLRSVEAERLLTAEVSAPLPPAFERVALDAPPAPEIQLPARWIREPETGSRLRGLPVPDAAISASPEGDFTVSFRVSWWRSRRVTPEDAATTRSAQRGSRGPGWYAISGDRLGVSYSVEGVFLALGDGLFQLEVVSPSAKRPFLQDLFAAWVKGFGAAL